MKIKCVEFENFRNFKNRGKVECSTDGRVTIVYGKNGDGKTTFHQLFQWVFYGEIHFNKTTTEKLYNLQFENDLPNDTPFEVMGRITFEHAEVEYTLRRTATYYKSSIGETQYKQDELELQHKDSENNWVHVDKPVDAIEKLLPSGLSEYFFFDGERMIADLSTTGADSAKKLKTALYSMFDLDILDMAKDHIGTTDLKKSVLGKLYLSKGDSSSTIEIIAKKDEIENIQTNIEKLENKIEKASEEKKEKNNAIKKISEQIGSSKSKSEYEKHRKMMQKQQDIAQKNAESNQIEFGQFVINTYPKLLISKAIMDASNVLKLKISQSKLPVGLTKELIEYLRSSENSSGNCICGRKMCDSEITHLVEFLNDLPPKSYTALYQDFMTKAKNWGKGHDRARLEEYIKLESDNIEQVTQLEENIRILDSEQKKSVDIEELVSNRQKAEARVKELDIAIKDGSINLQKANLLLKREKREYDKLTKDDKQTQGALQKIAIMDKVLEYFSTRLDEASDSYSHLLQKNIQELLDLMMDNDRRVNVSKDFAIRIFDNFNDESKSEGQFAITTFAFIGGIFKMLQSDTHLSNKEYPLVLDGPFSKLDPDKIKNVIDVIPRFAPQVILFSKDSLQDIFAPEQIGRVWTIKSNVEQNVAEIKEGYLW